MTDDGPNPEAIDYARRLVQKFGEAVARGNLELADMLADGLLGLADGGQDGPTPERQSRPKKDGSG